MELQHERLTDGCGDYLVTLTPAERQELIADIEFVRLQFTRSRLLPMMRRLYDTLVGEAG